MVLKSIKTLFTSLKCVDLSWKDIGGCGRPKVRVDNSTCVVCVGEGGAIGSEKARDFL